MGKHDGWRVRKVRKSWVGLVTVAGSGKERSKAFRGERAEVRAKQWAEGEAANERLGLAARQVHRCATKLLVADYLLDQVNLGRSASYCRDLKLTLERLRDAVPDLSADDAPKQIETFLAGLRMGPPGQRAREGGHTEPVSPRTRNKYLIAARGLCQWAIAREVLTLDPTRFIRAANESDYLRAQFTVAELRTMAQAIDHPYHPRFVAGFYLALRSSEVADLQWSKLDREGRVWDVTGKGDKQRLAHVPDEALSLLDLHPRTGRYLCTDKQRQQHASQQRRDLHAFCLACGITPGDRSPHSLRHSAAGMLTATGQPSLLLAAHMGHTSTQTTAGYTKMATRYMAAVRTWKRGQIELLTGWSEPLKRPATAQAGSG